jgi:hypothetical protein
MLNHCVLSIVNHRSSASLHFDAQALGLATCSAGKQCAIVTPNGTVCCHALLCCAVSSHPNIVQVFTYVLQPLMQGSMSTRSHKQLDSLQPSIKQQQHLQQEQEQQQLQDLQQQVQQQPKLQVQPLVQQQSTELQQQQPLRVQGAATQLLARFNPGAAPAPQQQQLSKPPDPGVAVCAAQAAADGMEQQQQQQGLPSQLPVLQRTSSQVSSRGHASGCDDSSNSLSIAPQNGKDLSRLTPEMAKAAAAALPAAAAAAGGEGGELFHRRQASSSDNGGGQDGDDDSRHGSLPEGPVLVGWELRLVMEFCDAVSVCCTHQEVTAAAAMAVLLLQLHVQPYVPAWGFVL